MKLIPLPAFQDNYLWLLQDGQRALVVDPGDAEPVLAGLRQASVRLEAILVTHHHADHTGGLADLVQATGAQVYGPALEKLPVPHTPVAEGDALAWGPLHWQVLDVPGHTAGHIAYVAAEQHWLFCGDTLFAGGCGRLFEGTPEQMTASLQKFAVLPDDTAVYCAHEYTVSNLRFAVAAEPGNALLAQRLEHAQQRRARGESAGGRIGRRRYLAQLARECFFRLCPGTHGHRRRLP